MVNIAHEFFGGCMIAATLVGMIALAPVPSDDINPASQAICLHCPAAAVDGRALAAGAAREAELTDARLDLVTERDDDAPLLD